MITGTDECVCNFVRVCASLFSWSRDCQSAENNTNEAMRRVRPVGILVRTTVTWCNMSFVNSNEQSN